MKSPQTRLDPPSPASRILINGEALVSLAEAGRPTRTNPPTVSRWCSTGIRSKSGERIRLESVRAGGRVRTSAEAVARFFSALAETPDTSPPNPSPVERRPAVDRAEAELIAAGA